MTVHPPLLTLRKRAEFLRLRGGVKWSGPAFLIECKPALAPGPARFGFTVTKKLGGAVVRNRMRRRLKEAVRLTQAGLSRVDYDYVIVGRPAALDRAFPALCDDFARAFKRLHAPPRAPVST